MIAREARLPDGGQRLGLIGVRRANCGVEMNIPGSIVRKCLVSSALRHNVQADPAFFIKGTRDGAVGA